MSDGVLVVPGNSQSRLQALPSVVQIELRQFQLSMEPLDGPTIFGLLVFAGIVVLAHSDVAISGFATRNASTTEAFSLP